MAFPGCVIFLPPAAAAAARFLLAAYDRWWSGGGACGAAADVEHRRLAPRLSHGPSHTEKGFKSEDMFLVPVLVLEASAAQRRSRWQCQTTAKQKGGTNGAKEEGATTFKWRSGDGQAIGSTRRPQPLT